MKKLKFFRVAFLFFLGCFFFGLEGFWLHSQEKDLVKKQEKHFFQVLDLMSDQKYPEAILHLQEMLTLYPESLERDRWNLELIRAYQYSKQDDAFVQTVQQFEQHFPQSPYLPKVKLLFGAYEWSRGNQQPLLQIYLDRLDTFLSPEYREWIARYNFFQGKLAFQEKNYHKTVKHLTQILELFPQYPSSDLSYYYAMALFHEAIKQNSEEENNYHQQIEEIIDFQLSLAESKKASFHYLKGKMLLRQKKWEQAREYFLKFLELREINPESSEHPTLAHGWLEMGNSYLEQCHLKSALNCYQKAISFSKEFEKEIALKMTEAASIKEQYELVLELAHQSFPQIESADLLRYVGIAYQNLGQIEEAEKVFGEYLGKFPNHHLWHDVRERIPTMIFERIYKLLTTFQYQEAKKWIQESAERFPNDPRVVELLFHEGARLEEVGDFEEAKEMYGLILSKFPSSLLAARALINLGYLAYENNEEESEYQGYFDNLFSLFPNSPAAQEAREFLVTKNQKFLNLLAPNVVDPRYYPVLQVQSKKIRRLKFEAYPLDITHYLKVKKDFQELNNLNVEMTLPQKEYVWEAELQEQGVSSPVQVPFRTPGVYAIRAEDGDISSVALLNITRMNVFVHKISTQLFLFAQDYTNNRPIGEAQVTLFVDQNLFFQGKTQKDGVLFIDLPPAFERCSLLVEHQSHVFFREIENVVVKFTEKEQTVFAFTDQREYYPGNEVQVYGWLKHHEENIFFKDQEKTLDFKLYNENNQLLSVKKIQINNPEGFFQASFLLESGAIPGKYKIQIEQKQELKLLTFLLRSSPPFDFRISCENRRISGKKPIVLQIYSKEASVSNPIEISYQLYYGKNRDERPFTLWETANFQMESNATTLSLLTEEIEEDCQMYLILQARQEDKEIRSEHRFWVKTHACYLTVETSRNWSYSQEIREIQLRLEDPSTRPIRAKGRYQIVQATTEKVFIQGEWEASEDGECRISVQLEKSGLYRIEIEQEEPQKLQHQIIWRVKPKPTQQVEMLLPKQNVFPLNEPLPIQIKSPVENSLAILLVEKNKVLTYQVLYLYQKNLYFTLPLKPSYQPEIRIRVALAWKDQWLEDETVCLLSQKLIQGVQFAIEEGTSQQPNTLVVQYTSDSPPKLFPILVPEENISPELSSSLFFETFFPHELVRTPENEGVVPIPSFSSFSIKNETEMLLNDKNQTLIGKSEMLTGHWEESSFQQKKLSFKNPSIPGKYRLFLFAFYEKDFVDLHLSQLNVLEAKRPLIQGPKYLYVEDFGKYTLEADSDWVCFPNGKKETEQKEILVHFSEPGSFRLNATTKKTQEKHNFSVEVIQPTIPIFQVYSETQAEGILSCPPDISWKDSQLEIKLWQGLETEIEITLQKLQEYQGIEIRLLVARLFGQLVASQLRQQKISAIQSLSQLYRLQNEDGSFGQGEKNEKLENTLMILYLFSQLKKEHYAFDIDVCRKALNFLDLQRNTQLDTYLELFTEYILGLHSSILSTSLLPLPALKKGTSLENLALIRLIAMQRFEPHIAKKAQEALFEAFALWQKKPALSVYSLWQNNYSPLIFVFNAFGDFATTETQRKELFFWFLTQQKEWGFEDPFVDIHFFYVLLSLKIAHSPQSSEIQIGDSWHATITGKLSLPLKTIYPTEIPQKIHWKILSSPTPAFRFVLRAIPKNSPNQRRYISENLYYEPWNQTLLGTQWFLGGPSIQNGGVSERWFVHLHLHLQNPKPFLILEDFFPSGASFVEGGFISGPFQSYVVQERKIIFYLDPLPPGEYDFIYPILWRFPGKFQTPSPQLIGAEFVGIPPLLLTIQENSSSNGDRVSHLYQEAFFNNDISPQERVELLTRLLEYPILEFWKRQILLQKMRILLAFFDSKEAQEMSCSFSEEELTIQDNFDLARSYLQSKNLEKSHEHLLSGLHKCAKKEIRLIQLMQQDQLIQKSQNHLLNHTVQNYPDFDIILEKYLELAITQGETDLLLFSATYPEKKLTEKAILALIQFYRNSGQFEKAITKIRTFLKRFPQYQEANQIHYELGELLYETAQYDEALQEMRQFISKTIENPRLRAQGRLLLGKIYQVKGQYRDAVEQFRYSSQLREAQSLLAELRSANLSVPKLVKVPLEQVYLYPIQVRNFKELTLSVYPLNLIKLFEQTGGLRELKKLDLTGVVPIQYANIEMNELPYETVEYTHQFQPFLPGAYLIQVTNGKLTAYTIVLVTNLKASISRFGSNLRLSLTNETSEPVRHAQIRFLIQDEVFRGATNIRGIWDIKGKERPQEILIEYQGEYEYLQVQDEN